MSFADFFSKTTVAYPSGAQAAEEGFKNSKYQKALNSMGKVIAGVAVAATMVACGPSRAQIEEMKAQIPEKARTEMTAAYDSTLLAKIDSLHNTGLKMEKAVEKGVFLTWDQARDAMPKKKEWTGKEYTLRDHADKRIEDSRETHTSVILMPTVISTGKSTTTVMRPQPVITYTYKGDFRGKLAEEVNQQREAKAARTVQTAKAVQNAGR